MADKSIKSKNTEIISAKRNAEGNIELDMNTKVVIEDSKWAPHATAEKSVDSIRQKGEISKIDMANNQTSLNKPQTDNTKADKVSGNSKAQSDNIISSQDQVSPFEETKNTHVETASTSQKMKSTTNNDEIFNLGDFVARHPLG